MASSDEPAGLNRSGFDAPVMFLTRVPFSFYLLKRLAPRLGRPDCADERGQRQEHDQQRADETYSAFDEQI